jgi:hypothetical protein
VDLGYTIFRQAIFGVAGYDPSYIDDSRWFQMMIHKLYIYIIILLYNICDDICSDPFASCRLPRNDQLEFHPPIMTNPSI